MIDRKTLRLSAVVLVGAVAMFQLSDCRRAGQPYDRCDFDTYWRYHSHKNAAASTNPATSTDTSRRPRDHSRRAAPKSIRPGAGDRIRCLHTWMVAIAAHVSAARPPAPIHRSRYPAIPPAAGTRPGAAPLAALPDTGRLGKAQAWGKHGHGCRQGPVLGDVQGTGGGGVGAARRAQQGPGQLWPASWRAVMARRCARGPSTRRCSTCCWRMSRLPRPRS